MVALAEVLAEEGRSASFLLSCASKAGVDVLPLLEIVQGAGLSISPQEFRAFLDGGRLSLEQVSEAAPQSHEYLSMSGAAMLLPLPHTISTHAQEEQRYMS